MQKLNKINSKINKYWKWFEKGKSKIEIITYLLREHEFTGVKAPTDLDKYILEQIHFLVNKRRLLQCKKH